MTFEEAIANDATLNRGLRSGSTLAEIITMLVTEKQALLERVVKLETIAPKKIILDDGRVMVWRCPDHLIP